MIGAGAMGAQLNRAAQLLTRLNLLEDRNEWPTYPDGIAGIVRPMAYDEEYRAYILKRMYHFKLVDGSILQFRHFSHGNTEASYCYYEMPFDVGTYAEFVAEQLGELGYPLAEVGDSFRDDYELAVSSAALKQAVTPIRYDYSPKQYEEGVHPAAHLHVGSANQIRVATRRLMQPCSFLLFVLRQMYPDAWRTFLDRPDATELCTFVRSALDMVPKNFFGERDQLQVVLE